MSLWLGVLGLASVICEGGDTARRPLTGPQLESSVARSSDRGAAAASAGWGVAFTEDNGTQTMDAVCLFERHPVGLGFSLSALSCTDD